MRLILILLLLAAAQGMTQVPFVNFENHPVRALDLSPDGSLLAVAHTADQRVQLFDVSAGTPVFAGHVIVGVDPVAVHFRTNEEIWVVNHVSDTVSIVNVPARQITATLDTLDEPHDVVFAGSPQRAYVSCSQANAILVFDPANIDIAPRTVAIDAEDPRALAVSPDGSAVYAAIFESGNGSTILAGATAQGNFPPNAVSHNAGPYGGANPPPNAGNALSPARNPELSESPNVSTIVKRRADGRWLDDNNGDWSPFVSGPNAARSGRAVGWDLPDRDVAIIDTATHSVSWATGLMNIGMALAVHPVSGEVSMVGTDATNEIRFEPNLRGTFLRVLFARLGPNGTARGLVDLNPHLNYAVPQIPQALRDQSIGDPRSLVWRKDGSRGYIVGLGSNNLVAVDAQGQRIALAEAGQGPVGLALSADDGLLYVWNHFEATLGVYDADRLLELDRMTLHNPLPAAVAEGRRHLYGTHETSGLGQASCASCHIDARSDRLAWDLGDPSGDMKSFNQNCATTLVARCDDFHPMKGPMTTQTLQDIIGKEPFHWRGDRDGIEEFNEAFRSLLGDDERLTDLQLQQFEDFLATIALPPNPYRNIDNSLSRSVPLDGHFTTGRFAARGLPLGQGDAVAGLGLFRSGDLDLLPTFANAVADCGSCHAPPVGASVNGGNFDSRTGARIGGAELPPGPSGENHLGIVGLGTLNELTMKPPQLRTLYEKVGFDLNSSASRAGFGFMHDGAVSTLSELLTLAEFGVSSDQEVADLIAFLLSFSGSDLPTSNRAYTVEPPASLDAHAAVGKQVTIADAGPRPLLDQLLELSEEQAVDLVASNRLGSWLHTTGTTFQGDHGGASTGLAALIASAEPVTFTATPAGLGERIALDRDGDGIPNGREVAQGSDPADAKSSIFVPRQGLWYNPNRSGHGIDLQRAGDLLAGTWYTYQQDGSPTWYQAVGPYFGPSWEAPLLRFQRDAAGELQSEAVGMMTFSFIDARTAEFCWTLAARAGCEPFQRFRFSNDRPLRNAVGLWFDPEESGYGLSIDTQGTVRVAVVYFYDADNQPRWAIGQSTNDMTASMNLLSVRGFCPDCPAVATANEAGGELSLTLLAGERAIRMDLVAEYSQLPGSTFERSNIRLVPLTDRPINLER